MEFVTKDLGIPIYYKFKLLKCNHNKQEFVTYKSQTFNTYMRFIG